MLYTVWSGGRLVGETDLDFLYRENGHRCGYLFPTEYGESLIPILNEPRRLIAQLGRLPDEIPATDPTRVALEAALEAAFEREQTLVFELRDANGNVIPTEDVSVRDAELAVELYPIDEHEYDDDPLDPELQAEIDAQVAEWKEMDAERELTVNARRPEDERPYSRIQVQVELIHEWSIP